jgi:ABC-type glycerol-3-phosphate transport system permease component
MRHDGTPASGPRSPPPLWALTTAAFVLGPFGFVTAWNDFLWPFIVLKSPDMCTVQIAIKALQNSRSIDLGLAMSGSFLATLAPSKADRLQRGPNMIS